MLIFLGEVREKKRKIFVPSMTAVMDPLMCVTLYQSCRLLVKRNELSALFKAENEKQLPENHILIKEVSPS